MFPGFEARLGFLYEVRSYLRAASELGFEVKSGSGQFQPEAIRRQRHGKAAGGNLGNCGGGQEAGFRIIVWSPGCPV